MLTSLCTSCRRTLSDNLVRFYSSAYRLNPETASKKKLEENKSESEKFDDHVEQCMLHKQRSPLRGFETVDIRALKTQSTELPNDQYYGQFDLPRYGSYSRYVREAERERKRQRELSTPEWNTMDKWWKLREGEPEKYVDIGMQLPEKKADKVAIRKRLKEIKKDPALEKSARMNTLELDSVTMTDEWEQSVDGVQSINNIAHHYSIYRHLFGNAHFFPVTPMDIVYSCQNDEDLVNPVYYGNDLDPVEVQTAPEVHYPAEEGSLWTLMLLDLDGDLEDHGFKHTTNEYLHWFVGNIKGSDLSSGEVLVDYMRPIPARGTGYHRMVFLLFQQNDVIDFSQEQRTLPCVSLHERSVKLLDVYKKYRQHITPTSLRFFQTKWDHSVQQTFHDMLDMSEPVYQLKQRGEKLGQLKRYPVGKTLNWMGKFMPKEPIFPGGGQHT